MAGKRDAPLAVRLDQESAAALDVLCARWKCGKAEAVRRALGEAVGGDEALRPVMEALARIEARLGAGVPGAAPAEMGALEDPDAEARGAADATSQTLAAWAMRED